MPLRDLINSAASAYGISPDLLARIVQIESGNNPYAKTGSYHGLLQLNQPEFKKYNPTGNIYDPQANLNAGAQKLAGEVAQFRKVYGYEPTPSDIYLTHQQGPSGYAAHTANPEGAAWRNIRPYYSDEAARAKGFADGDAYAKAAIWGNVPDPLKAQYGRVENVTSGQFTDLWRQKVEGPNALRPSGPVAYGEDSPALGTPRMPQAMPPATSGAPSPSGAPAGAPSGLLGMLAQRLGITPSPTPGATAGIPAQAPPMMAQAYQPEQPPPLEMPPFEQLQFAGQQPLRLAPQKVRFGRGFY